MTVTPGVLGVVMAGGRSERMRAGNDGTHKALVKVGDVSLLERSVRRLLKNGISEIVVVSSLNEPQIADIVQTDLGRLAQRHGAQLRSFVEMQPLGDIGVVRVLAREHMDLLVTNVDNLTSLDEAALLERHRNSGAAMTVATHCWPLANPFGEIELLDGFVTAYREKPIRHVRIASGSCVVSAAAAKTIPSERPCGADELCEILLKRGLPVAAYTHDALWIDINDVLALRQAERLIAEHSESFQ